MAERKDLKIVAESSLRAAKNYSLFTPESSLVVVDSLSQVIGRIGCLTNGSFRRLPLDITRVKETLQPLELERAADFIGSPTLEELFASYETQFDPLPIEQKPRSVFRNSSFKRAMEVMQSTHPDWFSLNRARRGKGGSGVYLATKGRERHFTTPATSYRAHYSKTSLITR